MWNFDLSTDATGWENLRSKITQTPEESSNYGDNISSNAIQA